LCSPDVAVRGRHQLATPGDQLGQGPDLLARHRPWRGPDLLGEAGDELGIQATRLGEPADGLGEGSDLRRVDDRERQAGGGQRCRDGGLGGRPQVHI
jgi:hypothetical protein